MNKVISLSAAASGRGPSQRERRELPRLEGRVLLVEDNPVNQQVAMKMLQKFGLQAVLASDGREGLEAFKNDHFNLVLMDLQMPMMDGFECTLAIRDWERDQGLDPMPIVALTANAMPGDRERCLEGGMNEHLPKPVTRDSLHQMVSRWLPEAD